jgi:hypothetical protein
MRNLFSSNGNNKIAGNDVTNNNIDRPKKIVICKILMAAPLVIIFFFLIVAGFGQLLNIHPEIDVGQFDCCPLVWKKLVETPGGFYVPSDAIVAGTNIDGHNFYYAYVNVDPEEGKRDMNPNQIGVIVETNPRVAIFNEGYNLKLKKKLYLFDADTGCISNYKGFDQKECGNKINIRILSNPNECVIGYWERIQNSQSPVVTPDFHFPSVHGVLLGRYKGKMEREEKLSHTDDRKVKIQRNFVNPAAFVKVIDKRHYGKIKTYTNYARDIASTDEDEVRTLGEKFDTGILKGPEIMYIDCAKSLLKTLKPELFRLKYDVNEFEKQIEANHEALTLHTTSIINLSTVEQETNVKLMTQVKKSLTIFEDDGWKKTAKKDYSGGWKFDVKFDTAFELPWIFSTEIGFGGTLDTKQTTKSGLEMLAEKGKVKTNGNRDNYVFDQTIVEPPNSRTQVSIMTVPNEGKIKFSIGYRVKTPRMMDQNSIKPETVKNLLKRLSLTDMIKQTEEDSEYFIFWKNGTLHFKTGMKTHVKIESYPFKIGKDGKPVEEDKKLMEYEVYPFGNTGDISSLDARSQCFPLSTTTTE